MIREILIVLVKALAVTVAASLGFAVVGLVEIPALYGLSILPAIYVYSRFESKKLLWIRLSLLLLLLGLFAWGAVFKLPQSIPPFIRMMLPAICLFPFQKMIRRFISAKEQSE